MTDNEAKKNSTYSSLTGPHRAMPIILFAVAVFIGLCFIMQDIGMLGRAISGVLLGLFSFGAYFIPFLIALHAVFYARDLVNKTLLSRIAFSIIALITISSLGFAFRTWGEELVFNVSDFYNSGKDAVGGGFVGSIVAFLLVKVFGNVGLIIIALAVFALYISFFFSGGRNAASRLGFAILKALVFLGAFIEEKIKGLFGFFKNSKNKRQKKQDNRKTAELSDDEFFGVDNSMQKLEITGLGILETRSNATIEARPTLQDKVNPKSAISDDEARRMDERKSAYSERSNDRIYNFGQELPRKEKSTVFDPEKDIVIDFSEKSARSDSAPFSATGEGSADNVFTSDFDPFKLALNEELASRPSSRAEELKKSRPTINESIGELNEEDAKRAREIDAFEKRKAAIIASRRRAEDVPAKGNAEFNLEAKTVDFQEMKSESISTIVEEETVNIKIEKNEATHVPEEKKEPSYTAYINEEDKVTSFSRRFDEERTESTYYKPESSYTERNEERQRAYERAASFSRNTFSIGVKPEGTPEAARPTAESSSYFSISKTPAAEDTARNEATEMPYTASPAFGTPTVSYVASREPKITPEEPAVIKEYMPPVSDSEAEDAEDAEELFESTTLLKTERTSLSEEYDGYDDDGEEDVPDISEEEARQIDGEFNTVELSPEEQNPNVIAQRSMFSILREEDKKAAVVVEDCATDSEPYEEDIPEEELEEEEFDEPSVEPEPVPEPKKKKADFSNYKFPSIDLLGLNESKNDDEIYAEIQENTRILIETLESFNVTASIKGVDRGPRITRYEVVPARGVKVREITGRYEDIELNLATEGMRMEAPIPGKSAIGFEIPNKHPTTVRLRELIETDEFLNAKSKTFVSIGKDVAGNPIFGDIAKYPHALICGATGMGKSVCINSILMSILYKARPDEVKLIMIDPKKVEFKIYSGIPHLLIPVITESKQAAGALMWAVGEMERRYELIEQHNVRNIEAYNEKVNLDPSIGEKLPTIIIVIDELADLMTQVRDPAEELIQRIAQKARAAGIHLLIGTQRPSVQVITGTIKANIPSRISCKVTSQIDSRTIFDMGGAERLLDRGDMLYWPVDRTAALRVQGAYVTDGEVEKVIGFIKSMADGTQYDDEVMTEINKAAQKCSNKKGSSAMDDDGDDEDEENSYYGDQRFLDAVELAIRSKKISTSLLQRKLSIGYGKAAKYIDQMENIGVVSEPNGQRPRDVLISMDEWHEKLARVDID